MRKLEMKILIIPDVHGRSFWRSDVYKVLYEQDNDTHIVFLGDYVDPYPYEWEDADFELEYDAKVDCQEIALDTLKEIIDLKKKYPNKITLLLGNHDSGYIWDEVCHSRRDKKRYAFISKIFTDNLSLFDLAYSYDKYLFTHAGVHKKWIDLLTYETDIKNIADYLNNWLHVDDYDKESLLGIYSYFRGYFGDSYGSCIWSDVREWSDELPNKNLNKELGYYQIFGHTQLEIGPIVKDTFACLDCRRTFLLDNDKLIDLHHPDNKESIFDLNEEQ